MTYWCPYLQDFLEIFAVVQAPSIQIKTQDEVEAIGLRDGPKPAPRLS